MPSHSQSRHKTSSASKDHPHYRHPPKVPATIVAAYLKATAEHFGTTPGKLLSLKHHGGGPPGAQPIQRQIAIYMLRAGTGIHMDLLADRFQRSRTTIIRSIALVERKLTARAKTYTEAVHEITQVLESRGIASTCDRCGIGCTPGTLCWRCHADVGDADAPGVNVNGRANGRGAHVLTRSNTKTKFAKSGREGGAGRTDKPPGSRTRRSTG